MKSQSQERERAQVSLVKAADYNLDELVVVMRKSLELIGGLGSLMNPHSRVFVKINHLSPASPAERGIVTHPVFVEAVLLLLKEQHLDITVGDDIEESDVDGFKVSGFRDMCNRAGVKLVNLRQHGYSEQACSGEILKSVFVSRVVLDSDVIVDLPKFKTHSSMIFTGAIKNMFGIVPAGLRRRFHGQYLRTKDFGQVLVDIFSAAKPQLTIMDGIVAMEGEGPGSGQLRKLGVILASKDAVAVDAVANRVMGLKSDAVLTTRFAAERGLGVNDDGKIEIAGEKLSSVAVRDFKLPVNIGRAAVDRAPQWLVKFMEGQLSPKVRIKRENCIACGQCVAACPTGAATIGNETAVIRSRSCIRCMCCHEVCRSNAIIPLRPVAGSVILSAASLFRKVAKK